MPDFERYPTYTCSTCGEAVNYLNALGTYAFPKENEVGLICPKCGMDMTVPQIENEERSELCGQED